MGFSCDPIIECQLNPGTTFKAPFQGETEVWKIIGRTDKEVICELPGKCIKYYSVNQFAYLMSVKRIFHFVEVVL